MENPNNCATCDHKQTPDGGHCYMFRLAPDTPCVHHTFHVDRWRAMRQQVLQGARMLDTNQAKKGSE